MISVYIHWPFCLSKCPYCDFNSHVGDTSEQEVWRRAYRRELEHYASLLKGRRVQTIFFGGGTPSLMEPETVASVLQDVARLWPVDDDAEITLEANPSSAEADKFADFRKAGVNRLSLGVQSLNDDVLRFFGRAHNTAEAKRAITLAAETFPRFSFDLIYGYKGHTVDAWRSELHEALALTKDHLSLYQLTVEPHTVFHTRTRRGEILVAPDDDTAALFEATQVAMNEAGLPAYEISNHAKPGQESRHNLTYWHYDDYIGIGPGAHGRFCLPPARHAVENHRAPDAWLRQMEAVGHGAKNDEELSSETAMREALMMGLRLAEGIDLDKWNQKFPLPLLRFLSAEHTERLIREGLVAQDKNRLRATPEGLQRLNAVLSYLL